MKAVFVGGGAHRLFRILRAALAEKGIFDGGEISLYDLDRSRAETMGRLLMRCPEFQAIDCRITWPASLDEALAGADAVSVILAPGTPLLNELQVAACERHGFVPSDNVSPTGALLGVKAAPFFLDLARRMERLCPKAWLLDFVNPVAVLSGMVNRHTKIKALGLCGGFTNHYWDIARILGQDTLRTDIEVDAVGVNHLSFIARGTVGGREIFAEIDRALARGWKMPKLGSNWSPGAKKGITRSVTNLVGFYRQLGVLIFSTEGDGMLHLDYEKVLRENRRNPKPKTRARIVADIKKFRAKRAGDNARFASFLNENLDAAFWAAQHPTSLLGLAGDDIFLRALKGIAGVKRVRITSSRLNRGAIPGLPDDAVCEYTQILYKQKIEAAGRHPIPGIVHGLISGLAMHQTMLGDACATEDPRLLAHALLAYPVRPYTRAARALCKDLVTIGGDDVPKPLRKATDYL